MTQVKNGLTIELEGSVFWVVQSDHVKPGKGGAFVRTKLKNIKTDAIIERTFRTSDKIEVAYIEKKKLQFLYSAKDIYEFMDNATYEQISLHKEQLGEVANCLKENIEVTGILHNNQIIALEPPIFVDMKIISTEPGIKGDTSKSGTKPAIVETGMTINVPLFVNEGDVVRIDTRIKEYVGRAQ